MTTPVPLRREQRRTHLDASVVPVERALLARAAEIQSELDARADEPVTDSLLMRATVLDVMASEFRALAEELHFW
jgi:uncharacterized membrane protein